MVANHLQWRKYGSERRKMKGNAREGQKVDTIIGLGSGRKVSFRDGDEFKPIKEFFK